MTLNSCQEANKASSCQPQAKQHRTVLQPRAFDQGGRVGESLEELQEHNVTLQQDWTEIPLASMPWLGRKPPPGCGPGACHHHEQSEERPRDHRQDGSSSLGVRRDHHNAKATGVLSRSNAVSKKLTLGSEGLHQEQNRTDQKVEVREQTREMAPAGPSGPTQPAKTTAAGTESVAGITQQCLMLCRGVGRASRGQTRHHQAPLAMDDKKKEVLHCISAGLGDQSREEMVLPTHQQETGPSETHSTQRPSSLLWDCLPSPLGGSSRSEPRIKMQRGLAGLRPGQPCLPLVVAGQGCRSW